MATIDRLGNPLVVGDRVVIRTDPWRGVKGTIRYITLQDVLEVVMDDDHNKGIPIFISNTQVDKLP